jgi:hypothetical protein
MDTEVQAYIDSIEQPGRRQDVSRLTEMISGISSEAPKMWGSSIISFGLYQYTYESGREGEAPKLGISNRKQAIVIYGLHISDSSHANAKLLEKLGKFKTGKGCLYISALADVDLATLETMIRNAHNTPPPQH